MLDSILRCVNPDRVRSLTFRDSIVVGGLQVASEKLCMLTCLQLDSIREEIDFSFICAFPCLQQLYVDQCSIWDKHFENMENLKQLKVLRVGECFNLSGLYLNHVNKVCPGLTTLILDGDYEETISSESYTKYLSDLQDVEILSLQSTTVGNSFFELYRGKLPHLKELNIAQAYDVGDSGLMSISTFRSLRELDVSHCYFITDIGLECIDQLVELTCLKMAECERITDTGLFYISKLEKLQQLDIHGCIHVTDVGVSHLTTLTSLTNLGMNRCNNLTDRSLELISQTLKMLECIVVSSNAFTITGLNNLLALPSLSSVDYLGNAIAKKHMRNFYSKLKKQE